jgi:hypothetical protein
MLKARILMDLLNVKNWETEVHYGLRARHPGLESDLPDALVGVSKEIRGKQCKSTAIRARPDIMDGRQDLMPIIQALRRQLDALYAYVHRWNSHFWDMFVDPSRHMQAQPTAPYNKRTPEEALAALHITWDVWQAEENSQASLYVGLKHDDEPGLEQYFHFPYRFQ